MLIHQVEVSTVYVRYDLNYTLQKHLFFRMVLIFCSCWFDDHSWSCRTHRFIGFHYWIQLSMAKLQQTVGLHLSFDYFDFYRSCHENSEKIMKTCMGPKARNVDF